MNKRALLSLVLAISTAATPVVAAPAKPTPAPKGAPIGYEAKYKEVLEAEKNEEYEKALGLLDQIPADKHTVYVRLKKAGLLVRLGKFVEAEAILTALIKDPAADAIRATVQGDLDDLRARMPKLTIRLSDGSKSNAWVTVDDQPVGPPVTLPLNPGTHVVVAKKGDQEVFRQKVTLQDSQNLEVEIDTSIAPPTGSVSAKPENKPAAAPVTTTAPATGHTADAPPKSGMSPVPFYVAGGVLVVGSVVSFVLASSAQSTLKDNCSAQTSVTCDEDAAGASKVKTWQTIGWISGGLAIASLGVGIAIGATSKEQPKTMAAIRPVSGGGTFVLEGRF